MKKKTRFKLKNDLVLPFWIAVSLCLVCAGINTHLFYKSFFRALEKLNEEPIAKITFKYKTAQRKFLDRVIWDRLQQNSPVYNGDTIHTAELSEATIWFDDGTILDLAENTMAQVFKHNDGTLGTDLASGNATVDSSAEGAGLTLTTANVNVEVKAGTILSAAKTVEGESVNLSVQKGQATLEDGTAITTDKAVMLTTNAGGAAAGADGATVLVQSGFIVKEPQANQKYLYYTADKTPVNFSWDTFGDEEKTQNIKLTVANDRNFTRGVQEVTAQGLDHLSMNLEKGTYYWRLDAGQEGVAAQTGRIQVIQSLTPNQLVPAENYSYQYRKKTPSLRFIWTEADSATAYNFAISRSPDMSNPVLQQRTSASSIIISTLEEGTYWWQVTPFYVVNRTGLANPSDVKSFRIEKRGQLTKPEPLMPAKGDFIDKSAGRINISWKPEPEAVQYKVTLSQNINMISPIVMRTTSENFITLTKAEAALLKDAEYFWTVSQIDAEGNESEKSDIQSFYALSGNIVQRTIFPPDDYTIWNPLVADTRFTWKTNLTFAQSIEFSRNKEFTDIAFEAKTLNAAYSGVDLEEGTYWWRLKAENGNFYRTSPAKKLTIVPELDAPVPLDPTPEKRAVVRPNQEYEFKWQPVEEAEYYRLTVYKSGKDTPVYDQNFISEPSNMILMDDLEEGSYRWEVRAYTYETETASRRSGKIGASDFRLRKIRPVTLTSPENNKVFGGWEAIENPPVLIWKSPEAFSHAELHLKKVSGIEAEEKNFVQKTTKQQLGKLSSGVYEWTVNATTEDELDISAAAPHYFTVEEIPPFAAPTKAETAGGTYFDAAYLRQSPFIDFNWSAVQRAQAYVLEITDKKGHLLAKEVLEGNSTTTCRYTDLAKLSKGKFNWKLRAVIMNEETNEVLIDGAPASGSFEIDFTMNKNGGKRRKNGELYGQ
ncbi:FecR domain-containing protein [Treponema sp. C6A8]|uniref:FecR domain-containing protein n=1 Tax=Treponema sp. C6A8 TaxID=1410609 RepID=UPI000481F730|nr:FecR domain-containing protein [Treponema sp. C6A8]